MVDFREDKSTTSIVAVITALSIAIANIISHLRGELFFSYIAHCTPY